MQARPTAPDIDPEPVPPVEPALSDCCTTGCTPCIFDLYQDALEHHEARHAAWRARQAGAAGSTAQTSPAGVAITTPDANRQAAPDVRPDTAAAGPGPAR